MAKALTREDLLYILQSIFRLSKQDANAFQMLEDGLYVKNYQEDLDAHANNNNIHVNEAINDILKNLKVNENGLLLYNNSIINMAVSKKEGNGISLELDGLYIPSVNNEAIEHMNDKNMHVSNEDRENWNQSLQNAKEFTINQINNLTLYNLEIVTELPQPTTIPIYKKGQEEPEYETIHPSSTTLYLLINDQDCPEECTYTLHMYLQDKWHKLCITKQTLQNYALKTEVKDAIDNTHTHSNKQILDKFTEDENGTLLYDNKNINEVNISDKEDNAVEMIDGKLYVKNLSQEMNSMQTGGFIKYNLYDEEINDSGPYKLKDSIDNYSLILVEYYYSPNDKNEAPGCAKTAVIDTDILNHLYSKNMDYMLEYGYGILTSNTKIRMHENKLWVDYYHNVNIYRITGIRRGDDNE